MKAKKAKVNREFKDGMFRTLFNGKEKMLELYNAVSDEPMGLETIEALTIETPEMTLHFLLTENLAVERQRFAPTCYTRCCPDRVITSGSYFAGSSLPTCIKECAIMAH